MSKVTSVPPMKPTGTTMPEAVPTVIGQRPKADRNRGYATSDRLGLDRSPNTTRTSPRRDALRDGCADAFGSPAKPSPRAQRVQSSSR